MKTAIITVLVVYVMGFVFMFYIHTQLPVTFKLALIRSVVWPISVMKREFWPRGTPLPMD